MSSKRLVSLALGLAVLAGPARADEPFSAQRALEHIRVLSEEIGPRKTGTPGERRARDYVAAQLEALGLTVSRLPVARVGAAFVGSENIMAVLPGKTAESILIGAHIDTVGRSVPGANDDASGIAVLLETARVLTAAPTVATLRFVAFCAEEEGMLGSLHFTQTQDLSGLKAMLNVDTVGQGEGFLTPLPIPLPIWATRALARVTALDSLAGARLDPLYLLAARSIPPPVSADHEPFTQRGVPALTIVSRRVPWAYHTAQDRAEWIQPRSLDSAGRLLLGMVRWLDEVPGRSFATGSESDGTGYTFVSLGRRTLVFSTVSILVLASMLPALGFLWWRTVWWRAHRRGRRLTLADAGRSLARAALPLCALIAAVLLCERLDELLSGYRRVWCDGDAACLVERALLSISALAVGLLAARGITAPVEPEIDTIMCASVAGGLACLAGASGRVDVAFYFLLPAVFTLAAGCLKPRLAGAGALIGYTPMLLLINPPAVRDAFEFFHPPPPVWWVAGAVMVAGLPAALGFARTFGTGSGLIRRLLQGVAVLTAAGGFTAMGLGLARPVAQNLHRRVVSIEEYIRLGAGRGPRATVRFSSGEYLRDLTTNRPELPVLDVRRTVHEMNLDGTVPALDAFEPTITIEPTGPEPALPQGAGAEGRHARTLRVLVLPPKGSGRTRITLRSQGAMRVYDEGRWVSGTRFTREHARFEEAVSEVFQVEAAPGQKIDIEIELWIDEDVLGLEVASGGAVFTWRSRIRWTGSRTV